MASNPEIWDAIPAALNRAAGRRAEITARLAAETAARKTANETAAVAERAATFLQGVTAAIQQGIHETLAELVTVCLRAVFPDPYDFKIVWEPKRGKTEARLIFERDGNEIDPMFAAGGGVLDVACFGLRLALLRADYRGPRNVLFLDEPFKFVSAEYRSNVRELIERLADELGVQFVIVTHIPDLEIGTVYEI